MFWAVLFKGFLSGWEELLFSTHYEIDFDKYLQFQKYSSTFKLSDVRMNLIRVLETTGMINASEDQSAQSDFNGLKSASQPKVSVSFTEVLTNLG